MRVKSTLLREWFYEYYWAGKLALGCWELRENEENPQAFDVRLTPSMELDGRDNLWHSWNYTFVPEVL
jgi:hypothetical protein